MFLLKEPRRQHFTGLSKYSSLLDNTVRLLIITTRHLLQKFSKICYQCTGGKGVGGNFPASSDLWEAQSCERMGKTGRHIRSAPPRPPPNPQYVWIVAVLRIRIRNPGSGALLTLGSGIRNRFFEGLVTIFWVKTSIILGKLSQNFFLQHIKNKIVLSFVKFVATKNGLTQKIFHRCLLLLFLDPGSGMGKNQDPGIRDKHPGSGLSSRIRHTGL
jgi:hypothetical protein